MATASYRIEGYVDVPVFFYYMQFSQLNEIYLSLANKV